MALRVYASSAQCLCLPGYSPMGMGCVLWPCNGLFKGLVCHARTTGLYGQSWDSYPELQVCFLGLCCNNLACMVLAGDVALLCPPELQRPSMTKKEMPIRMSGCLLQLAVLGMPLNASPRHLQVIKGITFQLYNFTFHFCGNAKASSLSLLWDLCT